LAGCTRAVSRMTKPPWTLAMRMRFAASLCGEHFQALGRHLPIEIELVLLASAGELRRVGGDGEIVDAADIGVDALGLGDTDHFVHRARHGALHVDDRAARRGFQIFVAGPSEAAG
jgi:hypothetical protein